METLVTREVAALKEVLPEQISRLRRLKQMPAPINDRKPWRWSKADIEAWVREGFVFSPDFCVFEGDVKFIRTVVRMMKREARRAHPALRELLNAAVEILGDTRFPLEARTIEAKAIFSTIQWTKSSRPTKELIERATGWAAALRKELKKMAPQAESAITANQIAETWIIIRGQLANGDKPDESLMQLMDAGARELVRPPTAKELATAAHFGNLVSERLERITRGKSSPQNN